MLRNIYIFSSLDVNKSKMKKERLRCYINSSFVRSGVSRLACRSCLPMQARPAWMDLQANDGFYNFKRL